MDDVFTSADKLAQESYVKSLRECFPDIGIIGEEESLSIPAKKGRRAFFTIDPIDGTKAYIRRQSHGIGSMVSLVIELPGWSMESLPEIVSGDQRNDFRRCSRT